MNKEETLINAYISALKVCGFYESEFSFFRQADNAVCLIKNDLNEYELFFYERSQKVMLQKYSSSELSQAIIDMTGMLTCNFELQKAVLEITFRTLEANLD